MKPLLATKADYSKIIYPVLGTPKLDGIRCLMVDGIAMSRSMKPIPNLFIQEQLKGLHGLDGELMLNGDFNEVMSGIMSVDGEPDFTYHVFDRHDIPDMEYEDRVDELHWDDHPRCLVLNPIIIECEDELDLYLEECLEAKYEGVMIRNPQGRYKFGRSTVNEGILLKIKKFFDDEAELIDVIEAMTNNNLLELDELGYSKRSSKKENLSPSNTAGSVILNWKGIEFRVGFGPGINAANKQQIWDMKEELKGQLVTFRYQELSKDGIPRFGKMINIRNPLDL